jgi:L-alanine-DL-glutamate epimerase-like enolase superfamily enzyme
LFNRRDFLAAGAGGLAASAVSAFVPGPAWGAARRASSKHFEITSIERTTVKLPFRPIPARNMARELPHWKWSEVFEVTLKSGQVGFGETLLYYTWDGSTDEDVQRARGKNAVELMWDDSLGSGLQMALFDAVARAVDAPVHALLGTQVNKRTPLSWWNIDTSPEDMAAECKAALRLGYMAYKTKGRPWFDVWKQMELSAKAVPKNFKIDMDFNDTLLDAKRAIPILKDLEKYPQVSIYESPIFQTDIEGNQQIRKETRVPIAMHYGKPEAVVAIRKEICDGFVIGGGATRVMTRGRVAAMADMPFWLQLVGSGITAAFSLHFGGVLTHATWPAVNCHQLYEQSLLTEPIRLKQGYADVPDKPGLGFELDRDFVNRLRVAKPKQRPDPPRLIETTWTDGRKMYFGNTGSVNFVLNPAREGKVPFFEKGVTTRLLPNDGSARWKELYRRANKGPLLIRS